MGNATTTTFAMVDPICKSYVSDALGHIVVELKRVLDHNFGSDRKKFSLFGLLADILPLTVVVGETLLKNLPVFVFPH